jgi:pimeloyl-[acyl-carrier protein] methyl ester esterase
VHIETVGTGPDLVLVHGWAMHGGIFAPLLPLLARRFRIHAVDLPGHGRSAGSHESIELAGCVEQIAARVERAIWVGWSFGGLVALHAAMERPTCVRGLVAIAASPCFVAAADWRHGVAPDVFAQFESGLRSDYRATIERFLALETLGSADALEELRELKAIVFAHGEPDPRVLGEALRVLEATDLRSGLARLAVPNTWIAGRRDRLVPAAAMRWSAQQARGDYVEIGSGHAPFLHHAREVAAAIAALAERAGAP